MNNIQNEGLLNPKPGSPNGYVSKNGEWAAVPWGKKFVILHQGRQVHTVNNYKTAKSYIQKVMRGGSVSTLTDFL
jgi:hypothetical protein